MPDRIFISSPQREFALERQALRDYLQRDPLLRKYFEVFLFEDLPALDQRADSAYLDQVSRADIYLGLFGQTYGFQDDDGVSPTEREFDAASAQGKHRIIFVKANDDAAREPKMAALIRKAGDQLIRRRFSTTAELIANIYASLVDRLERTGKLRSRPFDASACPDATLADLSPEKLERFLALAHSQRGYALRPGTQLATAVAHMNLLDAGMPTHAAVLLFGAAPQRFLISSEVKCLHYHGTVVQKPIASYQVFKGNVFELIDQAVDFVLSKLDARVGTRSAGNQAPLAYELPREAVAEAVVNAVMHRDYASNGSVQVMLFSDRLEVWNPGELPAGMTLAQLSRPHPSIPRNPLLAEPMFLSRYAEKAGSGTLDMIAQCAARGLRSPAFRQDDANFVQTLWRPAAAKDAGALAQLPIDGGVVPPTGKATGEAAGEATGEATGEAAGEAAALLPAEVQKMLKVLAVPSTRQAIMQLLDLRHEDHFRTAYIAPALQAQVLELTIPDKPTSPNQKYRLTAKGDAMRRFLLDAAQRASNP